MSLLRRFFPLTRAGVAMWAWRHRSEIVDWSKFAARAATDMVNDRADVEDLKAEVRLRASLARHCPDVPVEVVVRDGVAHLSGEMAAGDHEKVQDLAQGTKGIRKLDDRIRNESSSKRGLLRRSA